MKLSHFLTASVAAISLATVAHAASNGNDRNSHSTVGNTSSTALQADGNSVGSSNQHNGNVSDSNNSTDLAVVADNGNDQSKNISKDSNNSLALDNGNDQSKNITKDSDNSLAFDSNNTHVDSHNTSVSVGNIGVNLATTTQTLSGSVSHNSFDLAPGESADGSGGGGGHARGLLGLASGGSGAAGGTNDGISVATGGISLSGAANQNYAGIQTASYNTGLGSNVQAATAVTANASISFSHN